MFSYKNDDFITRCLVTPSDNEYFFGFHDLCPWSPDDKQVLLLQPKTQLDHVPNRGDRATIVCWTPETGLMQPLADTATWNYQQAARQQWLSNGDVLFNDEEDGHAVSRRLHRADGSITTYPLPIGDMSPNEDVAVTANYARLRTYWKAYGYDVRSRTSEDDFAPTDDGLWSLNLFDGSYRLLHSVADLVKASGLKADRPHFVSHPSFSPDGKSIAFLHRFFSADVALYTRLLVCNVDGSNLREIAKEKVSHFDWYDNRTIMVWSRFAAGNIAALRAKGYLNLPVVKSAVKLARKFKGRLKSSLLSEHYYFINVDAPSDRKAVAASILTEDGHPMFHPKIQDVFVTDTYPKADGNLSLLLGNRVSERVERIAEIRDGVVLQDSDIKCDLHPRWNRAGTAVGLDVCVEGRRQFALLDLKNLHRLQ